MKTLLTTFLGMTVAMLHANIVITEIMYNPAGTDVPSTTFAQEWVEIYNSGTETVDLTGWKLRDEDSNAGNWGTLTGSLAPGQAGVITTSSEANFKAQWSSAADAVIFTVSGWGSLANSVPTAGNEVVTILNHLDVVIDVADYLTVAPWPAAADGMSIYLLPVSWNPTPDTTSNGANWAWSALGVDGAVNPIAGADAWSLTSIGSPGTVVVPEPTTYALLLGLGVLGLLIARRRR
jgi:hypothetical protein